MEHIKLVFATHNQNKFREIQQMLPSNIELLSLSDIGCTEDIEETGETLDQNAVIKAEYVNSRYGYNCFADDTGLEVDTLNGEPGVYSARYAGEDRDPNANMEKVLKGLEGRRDRSARFKTVIALKLENHETLFTGVCEGFIIEEPRGAHGFGYDPIFVPKGFKKTFAEMTTEEKAKLSHRGKAFKELIDYLSA